MKIASAALQMESSHSSLQQHELKESLRVSIGNRRPDFDENQTNASSTTPLAPTVQISDAGKSAQSSETSAIQDSIDAVKNDPMLRLIRAMIAMLTGDEIKVFDASNLNPNSSSPVLQATTQSNTIETVQASQPSLASATNVTQASQQATVLGVEYSRQETYRETEQTSFSASGIVHTADGKAIDFSLSLSMSRSYYEESNISIRQGTTRKTQDPLVLNFDGTATQLTDQRFKFDLDSDGKTEDINFVSGGSGFLALDRNGDGKINNGSELFGVASGDGFADLSTLDSDQNGWIDENDGAYEQLRVWTKDASGKDLLSTLKQADVGAIALAHTATPFDLKTGSNELLGQIRSSGIYLHEDGVAGTIQQVDLTV